MPGTGAKDTKDAKANRQFAIAMSQEVASLNLVPAIGTVISFVKVVTVISRVGNEQAQRTK